MKKYKTISLYLIFLWFIPTLNAEEKSSFRIYYQSTQGSLIQVHARKSEQSQTGKLQAQDKILYYKNGKNWQEVKVIPNRMSKLQSIETKGEVFFYDSIPDDEKTAKPISSDGFDFSTTKGKFVVLLSASSDGEFKTHYFNMSDKEFKNDDLTLVNNSTYKLDLNMNGDEKSMEASSVQRYKQIVGDGQFQLKLHYYDEGEKKLEFSRVYRLHLARKNIAVISKTNGGFRFDLLPKVNWGTAAKKK